MASNARHNFVFRGTVELNPALAPDATHFINTKRALSAIRRPKDDGLVFGFMEAPEGIVITQVDLITLNKRVVVNSARHVEGGGLGPNGHDVGDQAARNVLDDVIAANPGLKDLELKKGKLRPI